MLLHSEGVTIDFQSYFNTLLSGVPKNTPIPEPTPELNTISPTTLKNSTSASYHRYDPTAQQTPFSSNSNPEYNTTELIIPVHFNALSQNESLLPVAEPYSVTVCLSYNNAFASVCSGKNITPSQASEKLALMILKKYLNGGDIRPFKVVMPSSMPAARQNQILFQIETETIALLEGFFMKKENQQNQNVIMEYLKIARQEAESGIYWSHSPKDDGTIHTLNIRKAFHQLNNISISGR